MQHQLEMAKSSAGKYESAKNENDEKLKKLNKSYQT
jgi:hypothetical protein